MTFPQLFALSSQPIRRWWLARLEQHYLICAEVEKAKADQALANVRHYQKQAALARSLKLD